MLEWYESIKRDKEVRSVVRKSKMFAEISKYGNEWKSCLEMESYLQKCENETEQRKAVEAQIKYQKYVLCTHKLFPKRQGAFIQNCWQKFK